MRKDGKRCCFYDYRDEKALRMGVKKNDTIWTDQLADELHKPIIKKFPKRKVYVNGIDKIWAADLVKMQAFSKFNHGVRYLLTVIDVFKIWLDASAQRQNWKICRRRVQGDFQKIKVKTSFGQRPRFLQQTCEAVGCRALLN